MAYSSAIQCLSDPTRRRVFERLRAGPQSVGALAKGLPVSRPAVSQHLRALREAHLVNQRAEGTRRVYYIDPDGLGELRRWIDEFWEAALESFKAEVEKSAPRARKKP
ncbi:MAG TPA: metalloregulator ArsR/SmtB family transcription factor [Steroidobacteraceae bacterium]|nr:metalloregulator ArsR/SmtB family transcription factor [Steroidobacteraceae bacterium]